jgi:tetratricopeptide (TPR) repeat protein
MLICDKKKMRIMNTRRRSFGFLFSICISLFAIGLLSLLACGRPTGFGIGGRYLDAKTEIAKPRGNLNKAISDLDYVVRRDPFYKDSLTLLGRAYYKSRRYRDAFQILRRALAVNREDEIAQIVMALTQLRLGDDERGLERFKGGITLLLQASKDGYRGYEFWDAKGVIRRALRRAVIFASRGLEEKKRIIQIGEILLARIDDEEWTQAEEAFNEEVRPDR